MASALNMNDLTANIASVIAPYAAPERLNAALYSSRNGEELYLQAVFSRCRTESRGAILMTLFGAGFDREYDHVETRARAWPFNQRKVIEVLSNSDFANTFDGGSQVMVFWRGDAFKPPVKPDVTEALEHCITYESYRDEAANFLRSAFLKARAPVAFVLGMHFSDPAHEDEEIMAAEIICKVQHFVGEVPDEEEE